MPVKVIWDDAARTTVRYRVDGYWNWDEIQDTIDTARVLMAGVDHPISVIVDLTRSRTAANFARWRGEQMAAGLPDYVQRVVMVGDENWASLFDIFARFLPPKARYAPTLDEARAMIAEVISTEP